MMQRVVVLTLTGEGSTNPAAFGTRPRPRAAWAKAIIPWVLPPPWDVS